MAARVSLTFRLPVKEIEQAQAVRKFYHYKNLAELYASILTEYCSYSVGAVPDCRIEMPSAIRYNFGCNTFPQACRVNPLVARMIRERCASAIGNTSSIWCALIVSIWLRHNAREFRRDKRGTFSNGMPVRAREHRRVVEYCLRCLSALT